MRRALANGILRIFSALQRPMLIIGMLLATGYAEMETDGPAGLPCLPKPFEQEALARAVEDCLAGARLGTASG